MARNGVQYFALVAIHNEMGVDPLEPHVGPRLALDPDAGAPKVVRRGGRVGTLLPAEETIAGTVVRCRQRQGTRRLGSRVHRQTHEDIALSGEKGAPQRPAPVRRVYPDEAWTKIEACRKRLRDLHVESRRLAHPVRRDRQVVRIDADA